MSPRPRGPCRTDFEAWLLTAMAEADITDYTRLATLAGTTPTTIHRICSGAVQPSIGTLKKLATALGCSLNELVTLEKDPVCD